MPTVDVRDVALAHYLALVKPGISGERFTVSQESMASTDIVQTLATEFNP